MKDRNQTDRENWHLIITRCYGSEILLVFGGADWSLPRLEVFPERRLAEQLTEKVRVEWGLQTYCLLEWRQPPPDRSAAIRKYALLDSFPAHQEPPLGSRWFPASGAGSRFVVPIEDNISVTEAIREVNSNRTERGTSAFAE